MWVASPKLETAARTIRPKVTLGGRLPPLPHALTCWRRDRAAQEQSGAGQPSPLTPLPPPSWPLSSPHRQQILSRLPHFLVDFPDLPHVGAKWPDTAPRPQAPDWAALLARAR